MSDRFVVLTGRRQVLRHRVLPHRVERRGRERLGLGETRVFRLRVAESGAQLRRELTDGRQHVVLAGGVRGNVAELLAFGIDGSHRHTIARAARFDPAGDHDVYALAHGDQARGRLVDVARRSQLVGRPLGGRPRKRRDERRALECEAERLLDRAFERGSCAASSKSAIRMESGGRSTGTGGVLATHQVAPSSDATTTTPAAAIRVVSCRTVGTETGPRRRADRSPPPVPPSSESDPRDCFADTAQRASQRLGDGRVGLAQ